MAYLGSILKSRHITLPTKVYIVIAMAFPVDIYGCESWTKRKLSAKELMLLNCASNLLEKTLESSLDCKEIKPVKCKGNQL